MYLQDFLLTGITSTISIQQYDSHESLTGMNAKPIFNTLGGKTLTLQKTKHP